MKLVRALAIRECSAVKSQCRVWNCHAGGGVVSLRAQICPRMSFACRYAAMKALQAEDVAQAVLWCLSAPDHVDTNDILMRPVEQVT